MNIRYFVFSIALLTIAKYCPDGFKWRMNAKRIPEEYCALALNHFFISFLLPLFIFIINNKIINNNNNNNYNTTEEGRPLARRSLAGVVGTSLPGTFRAGP